MACITYGRLKGYLGFTCRKEYDTQCQIIIRTISGASKIKIVSIYISNHCLNDFFRCFIDLTQLKFPPVLPSIYPINTAIRHFLCVVVDRVNIFRGNANLGGQFNMKEKDDKQNNYASHFQNPFSLVRVNTQD